MPENPLQTIITQGVSYAQLLADIRAILQPIDAPTPTPAIPEIGGIELAQEITRLSQSRIYSLVSERGIPHSKRGNRLYFNRAELLAWVIEGKRDGKSRADTYQPAGASTARKLPRPSSTR